MQNRINKFISESDRPDSTTPAALWVVAFPPHFLLAFGAELAGKCRIRVLLEKSRRFGFFAKSSLAATYLPIIPH